MMKRTYFILFTLCVFNFNSVLSQDVEAGVSDDDDEVIVLEEEMMEV